MNYPYFGGAAYDLWKTTPPDDDDYAARQAHEDACAEALSEYTADGNLPDGRDAGHVWEELGDEDEGAIVCDLLAAYLQDDEEKMLAIAKASGEKLLGIVNRMIESGLE